MNLSYYVNHFYDQILYTSQFHSLLFIFRIFQCWIISLQLLKHFWHVTVIYILCIFFWGNFWTFWNWISTFQYANYLKSFQIIFEIVWENFRWISGFFLKKQRKLKKNSHRGGRNLPLMDTKYPEIFRGRGIELFCMDWTPWVFGIFFLKSFSKLKKKIPKILG